MSDAANKLELLRRYAQEIGIPVDCVDGVAFAISRAARMIDVSPRKLRALLEEHRVPIIDLGPRMERVLLTDLIDFLWNRRRISGAPSVPAGISSDIKKQALTALRS